MPNPIEQNIQELWDNFKTYNNYVVGIQEGEEREKGAKEILTQYSQELSKINENLQTTDSGCSEKNEQDKNKNIHTENHLCM